MATVVYHSTSSEAALVIEREGFRDDDFYGIAGVCVSDRPLDVADDIHSTCEVVFAIDVPNHVRLSDYEIVEEGRPDDAYREWLVPADTLSSWPRKRYEDSGAILDPPPQRS